MTSPTPVPFSRRFAAMRRPRAVRNGWFAARYVLGSHAATYPLLRAAPAPYSRVMVRSDTQACIEGLPRSSNTFGVMAFMERNPTTRLAHHMHVPMQFIRAARLGIPCAVLIREPLPNLTSLVIAGENDLSHELAFRVYLDYFRRLRSVTDSVVVCTFDQVVNDPSVIPRRLNQRFATRFHTDGHGPDAKRLIVERLTELQEASGSRPGHGTVPSEYKNALKPSVRGQLAGHRLLPRAEAAYTELSRCAR